MKALLTVFLCLCSMPSMAQEIAARTAVPVSIEWVDAVKGDFSFTRKKSTTHENYSISSETNCPEWADTNFIEVQRKGGDTVMFYTLCNAATHCSLHLTITGGQCYATIALSSINPRKSRTIYNATSGYLQAGIKEWDKNILKAAFNFKFDGDSGNQIYWKGMMQRKIN